MFVDLILLRMLCPGHRWQWRLSDHADPWWELGVVVRRRVFGQDINDFLPMWRVSIEFLRDVDPDIICIALQGVVQAASDKRV